MRLAVVIPCHRRWALLPPLLAHLSPWPVIVVDDSPPDLLLAAPLPAAHRVVRTAGAAGFARAVNAGLCAAEADGFTHALLLNDDAWPLPGCIEALLAAWEPGVGAAGPVLLSPDGTVESAGMALAWWGRARCLRAAPRTAVAEVDALSGACLLVRASARLDVGFAHGFEDYALCRALRQAGERVVVVRGAQCRHLGGGTLSRTSRAAQRHAVSGHLRLLARRRFVPVVVGLAVAQVVREGGPAARLLGVGEGVADWLRARGASAAPGPGGAGGPRPGPDR